MSGALDLRRVGSCFKDMNGRLEEFKAWAGSKKRGEGLVSCDGSRVVLMTDADVRARREIREERLKKALWAKAEELLEARRNEKEELKEQLSAETARTQSDVAARVAATVKAANEAAAKAMQSKAELQREVDTFKLQLAKKRDEEEAQRDEEDERICRENAQANKRQKTDEDPQERIKTISALLTEGEEVLATLGTDLINARREREAEEGRVAEHKRELVVLRKQSGAYEGESSPTERMEQLRSDRQAELKALEVRAGKDGKGSAEVKRDAVLRHLLSFLKDDAANTEEMTSIGDLLMSVYGGVEQKDASPELCKAAAAALQAKTGLFLASE